MRIRSFVIAYALVLAILLFADRRPGSSRQDRYSHVVDLTVSQSTSIATESTTRIIAPGAVIPGTWSAGQIPPERLIAPLVVMDFETTPVSSRKISLNDIARWEAKHGMIPQGAVVALRRTADTKPDSKPIAPPAVRASGMPLPIERDAAQFLSEARYTIGFAVETGIELASDRTLARQLALHGSYVLEGTAPFTSLPATGSLIIVAPAKGKLPGTAPARVLAMVR
jgi:kynurenine formamidase